MADMVLKEEDVKEDVVKIVPNMDFVDKLESDDPEEEKKLDEEKKPDEEKKVEEKPELDAEGKPIVKEDPVVDEKVDEKEEEIKSLRQIAREQKVELNKVTDALSEVNKKLDEAGLISPEDKEKAGEVQKLNEQRQEQLDNLLDVMRVNPKFEDVDVVANQSRVDDLVEAIGRKLVSEEGGNLKDAVARVEKEIWAMRNPYIFLYENVKRYHPDYAAPKGDGKEGEKDAGKKPEVKSEEEKKKLTVEKVASSIQDISGGAGGDSGWTAARIDDMEESELDKVPKDIYDKYLRNELK